MWISGRSEKLTDRLRASMGINVPMSRAPGSMVRNETSRSVTTAESAPKAQLRRPGVALLAITLEANRMKLARWRLVSTIPGSDGKAWVTVLNAGESGAALRRSAISFVGRAGTFAGRLSDMLTSLVVATVDTPAPETDERVHSPAGGSGQRD